jgi:hypothetical protein
MADQAQKKKVVSATGAISAHELHVLNPFEPIEEFHASTGQLFTARLARELCNWPSIRHVAIWCRTTRAAFRQLMCVNGLEEVSVSYLHAHGSLDGMCLPSSLHTVRGGWFSSRDVRNIAGLPGLKTLGAQNSGLSEQSLAGLVDHGALEDLDIEASNLDDELAAVLATSNRIRRLIIGATKVGRTGLEKICAMSQLRELDIWALNIAENDLELLSALPDLEYLSIGGYDGQTCLTAEGVLPRIKELPSLRKIWLDGTHLQASEIARLKERYEQVQVTFAE